MTNNQELLVENNPFLTKKIERKVASKDARILFLYPNERGMSTIPPSIAGLSQILKNEGHTTGLFDTTFYKFDDEITIEDSDAITQKALTNRPVLDIDDDDLHFKKTTRSAVIDFEKSIEEFMPDFIAVSCTETTFLRAMKLIDQTRHKNIKNILIDYSGIRPKIKYDGRINDFIIKEETSLKNLFFAGDWTNTGWPSTMESAVISGRLAAHELNESFNGSF